MDNKKISKDILKQFAYVLNIAEDKLKELLRQYDNAQEELEKLIYYAYKNYSIEKIEEELNQNEIKKYGRIDKIDKTISNITKELNNTEVLAITMLLKKAYNESFNRNIYVLENNLKINTGVAFMKIPKQVIQNVIEYPIEGLTFSERIWANQFKLKNNLKSCIVDGLVKGKNIRTLSKELQEKMDTGRDNCSRLLRDQVARVWDAEQQKAWEETGVVEQVIWISTLDGKTTAKCRDLDGEIFDLKDAPDCPAHVNCRSCKAPYFKDAIKTRFDQENRRIIEYKNYEEWANGKEKLKMNLQLFGIDDKKELEKLISNGIIDRDEYDECHNYFKESFKKGINTPIGIVYDKGDRYIHIAGRHQYMISKEEINNIIASLKYPDTIYKTKDKFGLEGKGYLKMINKNELLTIVRNGIITSYYPSKNYINKIKEGEIIWERK